MTHFISKVHEAIRKARVVRLESTDHEHAVPTGQHKQYDRMEQIMLEPPTPLKISLSDAIASRSSAYVMDDGAPITRGEFSTLLGTALGKKQSGHRNYPSGGALYPIETYLITTAMEGVGAGVLHYNPSKHSLEYMWKLPHGFSMESLIPQSADLVPSTLLVLTSVWGRSSAKYGDFAFTLALLEAGHMSENILLSASALSLASRPLARFADDLVRSTLDLSDDEQPVLAIALGRALSKNK